MIAINLSVLNQIFTVWNVSSYPRGLWTRCLTHAMRSRFDVSGGITSANNYSCWLLFWQNICTDCHSNSGGIRREGLIKTLNGVPKRTSTRHMVYPLGRVLIHLGILHPGCLYITTGMRCCVLRWVNADVSFLRHLSSVKWGMMGTDGFDEVWYHRCIISERPIPG